MAESKELLKEWAIGFLKHKDVFFKKIVNINDSKDPIEIEYKDKKQLLYCEPLLTEELMKSLKNDDTFIVLAVLNTKTNLDFLVKQWGVFSKLQRLTVYFVNPYIEGVENKWVVAPYTHNKITEPKSLKPGLKSLFENVTEVSKKQI